MKLNEGLLRFELYFYVSEFWQGPGPCSSGELVSVMMNATAII